MQSSTEEKKYLQISAFGNVLVGGVGVVFAMMSGSQAILLDGLFNLTYFGTGLFTIKVASLVAGGDDERFPHGYAFFEPLVNGMKGMLVLGVSIMALVGALQALFTGGRAIVAGTAVAYGVMASVACWVIAALTYRGGKTTGSPLVQADGENWIVNAAISSCVLLAFAAIFLFEALGLNQVVPYVDPAVVLSVILISIVVPVRMSWNAMMALLNRAPTEDVVRQVAQAVDTVLGGLPLIERFIRVIQPGRQRMVLVHVVLPDDFQVQGLQRLDEIRERMSAKLCEDHMATIVDVLFTADRQWGAPLSDGGAGGVT